MHFEHSVLNQLIEKMEENDTGGMAKKCGNGRKMNLSDWTAVLVGDLKSCWGGMEVETTACPAESHKNRKVWNIKCPFFQFFP